MIKMTFLNSVIGFLLVIFCVYTDAYDVEIDAAVTVRLQHFVSIDGSLEDRGNITVHSTQTGSVALVQAGLVQNQINFIKGLAKRDGFYRLRASAVGNDGKETTYLTFVKACAMVESKLSDVLAISLDHLGNVVAVSASAPFVTCEGQIPSDNHLRHFNTTVIVKHMEPGSVPETAAYVHKIEREREARERGDPKDNRSFIAKYWMYIVPLLIFVMLSSAGQPDGSSGPGNSNGGGSGGGR